MNTQDLSERFIPMTPIASDGPVLFIDSHAPLVDLHACANERLLTALKYLNLIACAAWRDSNENDINVTANTARLLLQDAQDLLTTIKIRTN